MNLINFENNQLVISLSKDELFIIRAVLSEIYAGVCVDSEEFETIHGIDENQVLKLESEFHRLYDKIV